MDTAQILNPSAPRKTTSNWADETEELNGELVVNWLTHFSKISL